MVTQLSKPRRIELILRQIDSLPTLPTVATRLLQLTASDEAHAREVIELVEADPSLTAKVLSLCRTADKGLRDVLTVERAVMMLGFHAIRNAVLSLKVFETLGDPDDAASQSEADTDRYERFDREGFWSHALAVAIAAELIAKDHPTHPDLTPDQAFVCGLLHDIGKLALDQVLPMSYARVVEACKLRQGNIAEIERRFVGIDHHTAGKRLAEQWGLPHIIQDCVWLHGSGYGTLPNLDHKRMVGLIHLADLLVRRQMIGFSGNHNLAEDPAELIQQLDLDPAVIDHAMERLFPELERRGELLGLDEVPSERLLMQSIQKANEALGRLNQQLEARGRQVTAQSRVLETIGLFHAQAEPGRSVQDVLDAVIASARHLLGEGFYATLYPTHNEAGEPEWLVGLPAADGRHSVVESVTPPPQAPDLSQVDASQPVGMNLVGLLPWLSDYLVGAEDFRRVQLLPLSQGWGTSAILLHDRDSLPGWPLMQPLAATWGASVAAAAQHEGVKRLGEELAESNQALADAQDRLLRQASLARLGEMAAGAAHEMNNPLAVISGRSQLLSMSLDQGGKHQQSAQLIYQEAHRLSDLITALHMFADPPLAECKPVDLLALLDEVVRTAKQDRPKRERDVEVYLSIKQELPVVNCDAPQVARAVFELLLNAIQSNPKTAVNLSASVDHETRCVLIHVIDDGDGMDGRTISHAFDPFFSAKPAGRQVGMGLPRAQQLAIAHGGRIDLSSNLDQGTTATLTLPIQGMS
ncbi:MAG: HDOD domain-containing protein [Planctomycetota bacterium]